MTPPLVCDVTGAYRSSRRRVRRIAVFYAAPARTGSDRRAARTGGGTPARQVIMLIYTVSSYMTSMPDLLGPYHAVAQLNITIVLILKASRKALSCRVRAPPIRPPALRRKLSRTARDGPARDLRGSEILYPESGS